MAQQKSQTDPDPMVAALQELRAATAARKHDEAQVEQSRARQADAVRAAREAGVSGPKIKELTGLSINRISQIARGVRV